jgi:hypothetical protein
MTALLPLAIAQAIGEGLKLFNWRSYLFLFLLPFLVACDQAREAEKIIASAKKY